MNATEDWKWWVCITIAAIGVDVLYPKPAFTDLRFIGGCFLISFAIASAYRFGFNRRFKR